MPVKVALCTKCGRNTFPFELPNGGYACGNCNYMVSEELVDTFYTAGELEGQYLKGWQDGHDDAAKGAKP